MPRSLSRNLSDLISARLTLPLTVTLAAFISHAQTTPLRCDVVGVPRPQVDGSTYRDCLDLNRLNGDTLELPRNATRFAEDGLALCKSAVREGGLADIAYILDQSGSMYANFLHIHPTTGDTTFLENLGGCSVMRERDTVGRATVRFEESGTQRIKVLNPTKSIAGCNAFAGDPYAQRGVAFRNAIQYQSEISPASTAGYIGFNSGVTDRQTLLALTAENVQTLKNRIVMRSGGTNYGPPLDTAKRWLNNSSLIKTNKQAIIFLSDGKPYDSYMHLLNDGQVPPIYGIFLGNQNADFSKLKQLADTTGGAFYLIPPGNPDSLKTVVRLILNEILRAYEPISATLRNESLSPVQSSQALAAAFTPQGEASWRVRLSDIIALRTEGINALNLETRFRETQSGQEEARSTRFFLRTTEAPATANRILGDSLFALTCYEPSRLQWLDATGRAVSEATERDTLPRLRLKTAPISASTQASLPKSLVLGDSLAVSLAKQNLGGDSAVFIAAFPMLAGVGSPTRPATLETQTFDTVTARWRHPRDAQDTASLRVSVRAANRIANLRFSLTDGGPVVTVIPPDRTTAYLILEDQPTPSGRRTVSLTSSAFGLDAETVTLVESAPGRFHGSFTLRPGVKASADSVLQVSPAGDQLRAVFRDTEFGDSAVAQTGFDQAAQEAAQLTFVDGRGQVLADGAWLSPSELAGLKLVFSDDFALGTLASKSAEMRLVSTWAASTVLNDQETLQLPIASTLSDTRGQWSTALSLFENGMASAGDGILTYRYLGTLSAQVTTHDNAGRPETQVLRATLRIAYRDSAATLSWSQIDTTGLGGQAVEGLSLTLRDQDYAPGGNDSTLLHVLCPASGDSVTLHLKEMQAGLYGPAKVGRNVSAPNPLDAWLSCPDASDIVVRHVDPVFGTTQSWTLPQVAAPVADPTGREFLTSVRVGLSTRTPLAQIWRTLDGSHPDTLAAHAYAGPVTVTKTSTVKARATRTGYRNSAVTTHVYTKQFQPSRIVWLDAQGNALPGRTLTDEAVAVSVQVHTTQAGLSEVKPVLRSLRAGDLEEKRLLDMRFESNGFVYHEPVFLNRQTAMPGDDTLSMQSVDTLIAQWQNPEAPEDFAADTVVVKPRYYRPTASFTATRNGGRTSLYPSNQDSVYILIEGRPHLTAATARLGSREQGQDLETVTLVEIAAGRYVGALVLAPATTKTANDQKLSVALAGDQLNVVFVDPVYGDTAIGNAGFAQGVEETARLYLADAQNSPYAPDATVRPDVGTLKVFFTDDYSAPIAASVTSQTATVILQQMRDGQVFANDTETVALQLDTTSGTWGRWVGTLTVVDGANAIPRDGKVQAAFKTRLTVQVASHTNAGAADGESVSARLNLAYPDQPAQIKVVDENDALPRRPSQQVQITLKDGQQPTAGQALQFRLNCQGTTDTVVVQLVYSATDSAWKGTAVKGEGESRSGDSILTCKAEDILRGTYRDPTHGTVNTVEIAWSDPVTARLYYTRPNDTVAVFALSQADGTAFVVHAVVQSPRRDAVDTLTAQLTGPNGESETVRLIETGAFTGHFIGRITYAFGVSAPRNRNDTVEARVDLAQDMSLTQIDGTIGSAKASLILRAQVARISKAFILDQNRDGRADAALLVFSSPQATSPSSVTLHWNRQDAGSQRLVEKAQLSPTANSLGLLADVGDRPWDEGLTALATPQPMAHLPSAAPWYGQEIALEDSVGPVALKALKKPSDMRTTLIDEFEKRFSPDTLIITLSEPLHSVLSFKSMLRYSSGCVGYNQSQSVITYGEPLPNADRTEWMVLVDNAPNSKLPLTGDCVYLESDGRYVDSFDNPASPLAAKITGENPKLAIRLVQGYPPVAGINSNEPAFMVANTDSRQDRNGRFTRQSGGEWNVLWIPPVDFKTQDPMNSYIPSSPSETPREVSEPTFPSELPTHLSVVQVATTGRYVADVGIFDNKGQFVRRFRQAFGYRGELRNPYRSSEKGMLSFLVWDMKDKFGAPAAQGAYIWKIHFTFADGKQENQFVRTGILRR
jgi:Fn3 associated